LGHKECSLLYFDDISIIIFIAETKSVFFQKITDLIDIRKSYCKMLKGRLRDMNGMHYQTGFFTPEISQNLCRSVKQLTEQKQIVFGVSFITASS
jgi:hypothetical protein